MRNAHIVVDYSNPDKPFRLVERQAHCGGTDYATICRLSESHALLLATEGVSWLYGEPDWDSHHEKIALQRSKQTRNDDATIAALNPAPQTHVSGRWLPIDQADKTITDVQDFPEVSMTIRTSDRYWVRDEDGRTYEAAWSEGNNGREYWWDFEGESPVDPVEFMPHPLDPRFTVAEGKDNG